LSTPGQVGSNFGDTLHAFTFQTGRARNTITVHSRPCNAETFLLFYTLPLSQDMVRDVPTGPDKA